jgi:hypothetical protein
MSTPYIVAYIKKSNGGKTSTPCNFYFTEPMQFLLSCNIDKFKTGVLCRYFALLFNLGFLAARCGLFRFWATYIPL